MRLRSHLIALLSGLGIITATAVTWATLKAISSIYSIIVDLAVT